MNSTAVATQSNENVPMSQGSNPFLAAGEGSGGVIYMKFKGASGDYLAGQDEDEIPHGTRFAAQFTETKWGWQFWWDGEVLESFEVNVMDRPRGFDEEPNYLPEDYDGDMSLEDIREMAADRNNNFMDGWGCQAVLPLREIGGENEEYVLKLNAGVGISAFQRLLKSYGRVFQMKGDMVPIVELSANSYVSKIKTVGKRFSPVLKIVDWSSEEDLIAAAGEDPDMYDAPDASQEQLPPPAETTNEVAEEKPRGRRGARGNRYG